MRGVRVNAEPALVALGRIADPIERAREAAELVESGRVVQQRAAEVRRRAIYEATLRPGQNHATVAASLGVDPSAVSQAVAELRSQDRAVLVAGLRVLAHDGVCWGVPARALRAVQRSRDLQRQAQMLLAGYAESDTDELLPGDARALADAVERARWVVTRA